MLLEFDPDLFEFLTDVCETDSLTFSSNGDSCQDFNLGSNQVVRKQRKSRRRYPTPKIFKNDIRWQYSSMFVNVVSSFDVYMVYSFLKTFATPDLKHSSPSNVVIDENIGIPSFIKHWYVNTCVSPDIVYRMTNPSVRNFSDGSSEVSLELHIEGSFIYEKPQVDGVDFLNDEVPEAVVNNNKRKLNNIMDNNKGKVKMLGNNGVRLSTYVYDDRVKVGCDEDTHFLQELESIALTSFAAQPVHARTSGTLTMRLDELKRIVATEFVSLGSVVNPIELNEVM